MRASQILCPQTDRRGKVISFREGTLEEQRAYVWSQMTHKTCIYIDWSGDISRYNRPPSLPYTLHINEQRHSRVLCMIDHLCHVLDVDILVFDPFASMQKQQVAPFFSAIFRLKQTKNITVFFMLALQQAPIIQAEFYIDPRR